MDNVVIHGGCEVKESEMDKVTAAAPAFLAAVRQEDGLVSYELSWDVLNPNVLRLLEHWESVDAYTAHTAQSHVREWAEMMKGVALAPLQANKSRATAL